MNLKIYSKPNCPQCQQAKALLESKGVGHVILMLGVDYTREELLAIAPGARTVPQIVAGDKLIGGFPELREYLSDKASNE